MRSFASIATFATLAFASLASALPTLNANGVTALSNRVSCIPGSIIQANILFERTFLALLLLHQNL